MAAGELKHDILVAWRVALLFAIVPLLVVLFLLLAAGWGFEDSHAQTFKELG